MACYDSVVNLQPSTARLMGVAGDPFGFRLVVLDSHGDPVDVSLWEFAGIILTGRERLAFEFYADDSGVSVVLRGDDTARIPTRGDFPYDIAARQPTAGEGATILRGRVEMQTRQTPPLRSDPGAAPAEEPVPVSA